MSTTEVILVTGPAASGKTTLAGHLVQRLDGWDLVSEDEYWVRHGWGVGLRSVEQEAVVQAAVLQDVLAAHRVGRRTVLEFILYKPPPNPLTAYRTALDTAGIAHGTIALAPPLEEIIDRMRRRGRPDDLADLDARRPGARSQLDCVLAVATAADLLVDDASTTEKVVERWLAVASTSDHDR